MHKYAICDATKPVATYLIQIVGRFNFKTGVETELHLLHIKSCNLFLNVIFVCTLTL